MIAPIRAAATTTRVVVCSSTRPLPIVLATAVPANAPMKLNAVAMRIALRGLQRPRRDRRGDGVGRVVEAIDVVEGDGQEHDDDEHGGDAVQPRSTSVTGIRSSGPDATAPPVRPPMVAVRGEFVERRGRRTGSPRLSLRPCVCPSLFFATLRDDPADAEMPSHRLLQRAGYVRQLGSGIYSLLPLGFRVNKRVEQIIREEMDRIGSQEIEMPVVHPADVWRASGRYDAIGPELGRFKDRNGRDMVLAMTHEEVVGAAARRHREVVPPAADDGLPLPDEVARRAARARRPHPRPRVRHEGRLQLRPRRGRPRCQLLGAARRLRPDLRASRARDRSPSRPTSG